MIVVIQAVKVVGALTTPDGFGVVQGVIQIVHVVLMASLLHLLATILAHESLISFFLKQ